MQPGRLLPLADVPAADARVEHAGFAVDALRRHAEAGGDLCGGFLDGHPRQCGGEEIEHPVAGLGGVDIVHLDEADGELLTAGSGHGGLPRVPVVAMPRA
jgi:hypothetical protein